MRLFTSPFHPLKGKSQKFKCCKNYFQKKKKMIFLCNEQYAAPLQKWPIPFIVSTLFRIEKRGFHKIVSNHYLFRKRLWALKIFEPISLTPLESKCLESQKICLQKLTFNYSKEKVMGFLKKIFLREIY